MKNIGKGLFADGLSVTMGGLFGGMATDTSASNVGLSAATSTTSRSIGYYVGIIFVCMAFLPKADRYLLRHAQANYGRYYHLCELFHDHLRYSRS